MSHHHFVNPKKNLHFFSVKDDILLMFYGLHFVSYTSKSIRPLLPQLFTCMWTIHFPELRNN